MKWNSSLYHKPPICQSSHFSAHVKHGFTNTVGNPTVWHGIVPLRAITIGSLCLNIKTTNKSQGNTMVKSLEMHTWRCIIAGLSRSILSTLASSGPLGFHEVFYIAHYLTCLTGDAQNWTWYLLHAKHMIYFWATAPSLMKSSRKQEQQRYLRHWASTGIHLQWYTLISC